MEKNKKGMVVSLPKDLKIIIDSNFSEYNEKICFLIYVINEKLSPISCSEYISEFFGISSDKLFSILQKLVKLNILDVNKNGEFKLISNYHYKDENIYKEYYYEFVPAWVQRYIVDGFRIVEKTKYNPLLHSSMFDVEEEEIFSNMFTMENTSTVKKYEDEIKRLKEVIRLLVN